ncbi:putative leucine-rich repeat-containing protein DDB_G0290503 [Stylophora pistillata]|uniref:Protein FAM184A n=1 Tax=Stylophora pistillata TaxID=50429 RepID=A0A2B4T190_STYPI|nr:putative leucine-rich repeat-containing protein DDB_G0290503 [Stylophora pistillata]PFX34910.1 Protein FAM184A [Stylophora pistillata]
MAHHRDKDREPDLKGKLSRKIAELTMVIHLLFTRNHEREIEVESLKTAYEHEISVILEEAKGKISWLEGQLDELEKYRVLLDLKNTEIEKNKQQIQDLQNREEELNAQLGHKDQLLTIAEKQIVQLKESLMDVSNSRDDHLSGELENVKKDNSNLKEKIKVKNDKIKKSQNQVDNLQSKLKTLEDELKDVLEKKQRLEASVDGLQGDWQDEIERLGQKITEYTKQQQEDQIRADKLEWKNKQLSHQVKELEDEKQQLELKIQQYIDERNKRKESKRSPRSVTKGSPEVPRPSPIDRDDELERLRREVQRYRLELSNREMSFNRMFTDHKPVIVDPNRRKTSSNLAHDNSFPNLSGVQGRKRSGIQQLPALGEQRIQSNPQQQFHGL